VTREAFAEPYGGDLRGTPRFVILGLNPGQAALEFQARDGIFANEIRELGSYSAWAASHPYLGETWTRAKGPDRYGWARLKFARGWLEDPDLEARDVLTFELYPWHSTSVTASIVPPPDIVNDFVWQPIADMPVEFVFAFGKPWLRACERLGLRESGRWGNGLMCTHSGYDCTLFGFGDLVQKHRAQVATVSFLREKMRFPFWRLLLLLVFLQSSPRC